MNAMQESTNPQAPQQAQAPPYVQAPPVAVQPVMARDPRSKSPALAACLSCMPGLGQVYVGFYQRGFIHAVVVASIITLLASDTVPTLAPLFGLFLAFFWLYNIIDAARRASLYNQMLAGSPAIEMPEDFKMPSTGGSIFGGACLIAFGFVLLLHTRFGMSLEWMHDWWPLALMIFGGYLLVRAIQDRQAKQPAGPGDRHDSE